MIRFAIIGTGNIAHKFAAAVNACEEAELAAVMSRDAQRGRAFAKECDIPIVYTSVEELAKGAGIDAVYIASPNACHAPQAIQLLWTGRHVLCEKPIATTHSEARAMVEMARQSDKILLEAIPTIFYPGFSLLRQLIPKIGKIRRVTSVCCQYSSRYDAVKSGEKQNAFDKTLGNAALLDLGVYCVQPTLALLGTPEDLTANSVFINGFEAQGTVSARFGAAQADWIYSKISDSRLPSEIQGEEGSIIVARWNRMEHFTLLLRDGTTEEFVSLIDKNELVYELDAFIEMVKTGTGHEVYNDLSLACMAVLDGAREKAGINFE